MSDWARLLSPLRGFGFICHGNLRLTPEAKCCRRSAAQKRLSHNLTAIFARGRTLNKLLAMRCACGGSLGVARHGGDGRAAGLSDTGSPPEGGTTNNAYELLAVGGSSLRVN